MDFAPPKTFKTPKKAVLCHIENGTIDPSLIKRYSECTGFPFEIVSHDEDKKLGKDKRRACVNCGSNTAWYCIGCKQFLCYTYKKNKNRKEEKYYYTTEKENEKPSSRVITKIYGMTCFHNCHPAMKYSLQALQCLPVSDA